jgi:hypothetical protein
MKDFYDRLTSVTAGCRDDMHEPDEQSLKARVVGTHLDNAFGDSIIEDAVVRGFQEYVVVLERYFVEDGAGGEKIAVEKFNLATLIALAKMVRPEDVQAREDARIKAHEEWKARQEARRARGRRY